MRSIILVLLLCVVSELWLCAPKTKIQIWQGLNPEESSIAVTPQILVLRRNFEDILDKNGISTIPLGSRSKSSIIFCAESNGMIQYRSDRYGFRNPDEAWDKPIDIAMVGDSFAQGACVPDGDDIASQLRPAFGNVLNLGSVGNGPLGNLAVASEYLRETPPKRILWFYVGNDLVTDTPIEEQTPLLTGYKDPNFTQALKLRQADVDAIISDFLKEEAAGESAKSDWLGHAKLTNIQNALTRLFMKAFRLDSWRQGLDMDYAKQDLINYDSLNETLAMAKARFPETRIQFVIVADAGMFSPQHKAAAAQHIEKLREMMQGLGIEVIDLREAFRDVEKPLDLYAIKDDGSYGHYTPEGYRLVSDYLKTRMK